MRRHKTSCARIAASTSWRCCCRLVKCWMRSNTFFRKKSIEWIVKSIYFGCRNPIDCCTISFFVGIVWVMKDVLNIIFFVNRMKLQWAACLKRIFGEKLFATYHNRIIKQFLLIIACGQCINSRSMHNDNVVCYLLTKMFRIPNFFNGTLLRSAVWFALVFS